MQDNMINHCRMCSVWENYW